MRQAEVMRSGRWSFSRFYGLPLLAVLALGLLGTIPTVVSAEEPTTTEMMASIGSTASATPTDKLMLRGGWAYVFGATANVSVGGPALGVGTNIDLTNTLGVDTSTDAFRLDGLYRFNDRHAIGLSWYRVGLSGEKSINEQIQIRDQTVAAGAAYPNQPEFQYLPVALQLLLLPERESGVGSVARALRNEDNF